MREQQRSYWLRRWAKALRETTAYQITDFFANSSGGRCAWGVFQDDLILDGLFHPDLRAETLHDPDSAYGRIREDVGVAFGNDVVVWNDDDRLTFAEIADRLDAEADYVDAKAERGDAIACVVEERRDAPALLA
jgi:hypothetical protein